jgi:hypothetical protein
MTDVAMLPVKRRWMIRKTTTIADKLPLAA